MNEMKIRIASEDDAERLLEIYGPYVRNTAITFEYDVPTVEEFRGRIRNTLEKRPYYVAIAGDRIIGYAYTGAFKGRAAYDRSEEISIYVDANYHGNGVGRKLYEAMESVSKRRGILNLYACIAVPAKENDPYLTWNSVRFHERMGYKTVGTFHSCGFKFNRWYDMVWMEKMIGEHREQPVPVQSFPLLTKET